MSVNDILLQSTASRHASIDVVGTFAFAVFVLPERPLQNPDRARGDVTRRRRERRERRGRRGRRGRVILLRRAHRVVPRRRPARPRPPGARGSGRDDDASGDPTLRLRPF